MVPESVVTPIHLDTEVSKRLIPMRAAASTAIRSLLLAVSAWPAPCSRDTNRPSHSWLPSRTRASSRLWPNMVEWTSLAETPARTSRAATAVARHRLCALGNACSHPTT